MIGPPAAVKRGRRVKPRYDMKGTKYTTIVYGE
jgi:hypothetical protein